MIGEKPMQMTLDMFWLWLKRNQKVTYGYGKDKGHGHCPDKTINYWEVKERKEKLIDWYFQFLSEIKYQGVITAESLRQQWENTL
jgi:hypothetical protein